MQLTRLALKRPVSVLLLLFTLIVFGISSISGFRMASTPQMEMPMFIIFTNYTGAEPEIIDSTVGENVEKIGATIPGFSKSTATSVEGSSRVVLQFDYGVDLNQTYMDIKTAVDRLDLPQDASEPVIMQISTGSSSMMTLSITGAEGEDTRGFADNVVVPQIDTLLGIAEVTVSGGASDYIRVIADPVAMELYGVTLQTIGNSLSSNEYEMPIGDISQGDQDISASSGASAESLTQLKNIPVSTPQGSLLTLSDVADVSIGTEPMDSISRYDGNDNVSIQIKGSQDASIPDLADDIKKELEILQKDNPDIKIDITEDSSVKIIESIVSVANTLILGVVLCMAVLFAFFGNIKASLIVGSSIPISLVSTLICMSMLDFELNLITTSALVIAIGMMVDNSIVVLESIFKAKEQCDSFSEAALKGCKTVGASVVASTITTIVVYLPMAVLDGMAGQLFSELGFTIVFAMIASLISAITLVPLFYFLLKPTEKKKAPMSKLMVILEDRYDNSIRKVLNKKKMAVTISVVSLLASFVLVTQIPIEMMPETDDGIMEITSVFRPGTKIEVMEDEISVIENMIVEDARFESYNLSIKNNEAKVTAYIGDDTPTRELIDEYMITTADIPNMTIDVGTKSVAMGSSANVESTLSGYDYEALKAAAVDFESKIYEIPGVIKVAASTGSSGTTKADIKIDPKKAANYGLNPTTVSQILRQSVTGMDISTMELYGDEYEIKVEYPDGVYDTFNDFMHMPITTQKGVIPLSEIAELTFTDNPQSITRKDGIYSVDLEITTLSESQESVEKAIADLEKEVTYGDGVKIGKGSSKEIMKEEMMSIVSAIGVAVFLVFIVMAMQFESVRFSLMVMTSIVFSFIGSFGLLFLSGTEITMVSLMGILMLVGIVVNNGILFVDTANVLKKDMTIEEALIASGKLRMRPILMTTMTTVLSMIPLALGIGEGSKMLQSMGVIIIGGLITSTILILFLMPTFYLIIGKKRTNEKKEKILQLEQQ